MGSSGLRAIAMGHGDDIGVDLQQFVAMKQAYQDISLIRRQDNHCLEASCIGTVMATEPPGGSLQMARAFAAIRPLYTEIWQQVS